MAQFLDLPTEVRIKVYRYVFDGQKLEFCRSYEANPRGSIHWWRLRIPKSASVVGASRQLRQEAYPELIQRCSIEFAEAFVCGWVLNGINSNSLWYTTMQHAQISLKPEYNGISGSMGSVDTIRRVLGGLQNLKMLKLSLQNYFCKMTPGYKWREELSAQHLHDVFKQDLLEPGPTVLGVGRSGHGIVKNFIKAWQQLDFPCDLKTTFKVSDFVEHLWECDAEFDLLTHRFDVHVEHNPALGFSVVLPNFDPFKECTTDSPCTPICYEGWDWSDEMAARASYEATEQEYYEGLDRPLSSEDQAALLLDLFNISQD